MKHIVIIGNCAAGIAAAEVIRKRDRDSKLTIISDENYSAYYRCIIPNLLAGDIKEKGIIYRDEAFYKKNKIDLLLNKKAIEIRDKKNIVVVRDAESSEAKKEQVKYDALILANGAS
ncbi:MAG: NAD(P)/FAD-dependent oxidoreductase, partial [Candidatus Omnitrophica bacterium]|nr:NAD(P)/FAD-dependent oxidoreductase [Candidatus Omnitrophota bacterium]